MSDQTSIVATNDAERDCKVYVLSIANSDIVSANLKPSDFDLFRECDKSASIADKLLALENLMRRIEEGATIQFNCGKALTDDCGSDYLSPEQVEEKVREAKVEGMKLAAKIAVQHECSQICASGVDDSGEVDECFKCDQQIEEAILAEAERLRAEKP